MRIGVITRTDIEEPVNFTAKLIRFLSEYGAEIFVEKEFYLKMPEQFRLGVKEPIPSGDALDLLVVVGGDGTLLKTLQGLRGRVPPLLTIRMGRYGFLMEAEPEEAYEYIESFLKGRCRVKMRSRIIAYFKGYELPPVLNEYAILASQGKMVKFKVGCNGREVYTVSGDGLLISTTSGSTAYALSAGGPIVDEDLDVILVVPLNPFHIHMRPVVLPLNSEVIVSILSGRFGATIYADGVETALLKVGQEIEVRPYDKIPFVCLKDDYYSRVSRRVIVDP